MSPAANPSGPSEPPPRPHVAILVGGIGAGEGDPFTSSFAGALRAWSKVADLALFPLRYPQLDRPYEAYGARILPQALGDPPLKTSPQLWRAVVRAVGAEHQRHPFDLVFTLQSAEPGMVGAMTARFISRPLVSHFGGGELVALRDLGYGSQAEVAGRTFVATALRAARVHTCGSRHGLRLLRTRLGAPAAASIRLAPLPVDVDRFRPRIRRARRKEISRGAEPTRLLCVADLNPVKNHRGLLNAFALLTRRLPETRLDLVGGGPCLADLRRQAKALGIAERVRWWGQVPHEAVHLAYAQADAYVSASRHEGQGIALLEAASCALPIATTPVGIATELPDGMATLAAHGDSAALAHAMATALDERPVDKATRRARRNVIRERWGPEASARAVLEAWQLATLRPSSAPSG